MYPGAKRLQTWRLSNPCELFLTALLLCGLIAGPAQAQIPVWLNDVSETHDPDLSAVHADDEWLVWYQRAVVSDAHSGGLTVRHYKVWRRLGEQAAPLIVPFAFDEEQQELTAPQIFLKRRRAWRSYKYDRKAIEVPDLTGEFITGDRALMVRTPPLKKNAMVAAAWTITDQYDFPGERLFVPINTFPTAHFQIDVAEGADVRLFEGSQAKRELDQFVYRGVPAGSRFFRPDDYWRSAPLASYPFVLASREQVDTLSWAQLARRVRVMFDEALTADDSHIAKARELTVSEDSQRDKINAVAHFAQSLVYRNVEWGIGAYKPTVSGESLRTLSADCKGKVLLLHGMLNDLGIASVPVLARIREQYLPYTGPPTAGIFNHMVLAIDADAVRAPNAEITAPDGKRWVVFDPTNELSALGVTPSGLHGTPALWLGDNADYFEFDLSSPGDRISVDVDFALDTDHRADFKLSIVGGSGYAELMRKRSPEGSISQDVKQFAQDSMRRIVPGLELTDVRFTHADFGTQQPARVELIGQIDGASRSLPNKLHALAAPTEFVRYALSISKQGYTREQEDALPEAQAAWQTAACCANAVNWYSADINLRLPAGYSVRNAPKLGHIDAPWMQARSSLEGQRWSLEVYMPPGDFGADHVQQRLDDMNRLSRLLRRQFVLSEQ